MALNTVKCSHLLPLGLKGLIYTCRTVVILKELHYHFKADKSSGGTPGLAEIMHRVYMMNRCHTELCD